MTDASRPQLPAFADGETKKISFTYTPDENGVMQIAVASEGFNDDINQVALMLSFTLEKLLGDDAG